ncbi:MAG: hypothetical protein ACK4Z4_08030 [Ferrovibrio sp.]
MTSYIVSTVLTANFAAASLVLARSVVETNPDAVCHLYCLDDAAHALLAPVIPARVRLFCARDLFDVIPAADYARLEAGRPVSAFCWTLKPVVIAHAMKVMPNAEWYAFSDSDMMVTADLAPRFAAARTRSALATPHAFRYPLFWGTEYLYGHYNAGFVAFRATPEGRAMLQWWRGLCLTHCPALPEPDAFGDQKYIEQMVIRYPDQVSTGFPFINAAAWNIGQEEILDSANGPAWRGQVIRLYHFQGLRLLGRGWVDLYSDTFPLSASVRRLIYRPYVKALRQAIRDIGPSGDALFEVAVSIPELAMRLWQRMLGRRSLVHWPD